VLVSRALSNREPLENDSQTMVPEMEKAVQDVTLVDEAFDLEQILRKLVQRCAFYYYLTPKY